MTPDNHTGNIFSGFTVPEAGELFQEIIRSGNVMIERIVSSDIFTPAVYCQAQDEWVIVLEGNACLEMEGRTCNLGKGDYVFIEAGVRHRVVSAEKGTLWLAVHIFPDDQMSSITT